MTWNPNHDRAYWRGESDRRLIEAARDSGHELAIALGERLDSLQGMEETMLDLQTEAKDLEARADAWKADALALQEQVDALYDQVADLEALAASGTA
jgi:chromosome segregation ATPase